jgi:hypothetical protein
MIDRGEPRDELHGDVRAIGLRDFQIVMIFGWFSEEAARRLPE